MGLGVITRRVGCRVLGSVLVPVLGSIRFSIGIRDPGGIERADICALRHLGADGVRHGELSPGS